MRYLCLIYENEKAWETMPKDEADAVFGEYFAFTEGIKQSGQLPRRRSAAADADRDDRARAQRQGLDDRRPVRRDARSSSAATT